MARLQNGCKGRLIDIVVSFIFTAYIRKQEVCIVSVRNLTCKCIRCDIRVVFLHCIEYFYQFFSVGGHLHPHLLHKILTDVSIMSFAMIGVYAGKGILLSVKLGEFDRFLILRYILRIHTLQIRPQVYQSSLASVSGNTLSVICPDDIRRCACSQHQVYLIISAGTRNRNEIHMNSLGFHRFINPACQFIVRQGIPR